LRTWRESGPLKNSHQTFRIFLNIGLIASLRNAANPAGVPIAQSRIAFNGVPTSAVVS
jgi:hypothetical protein